jgi:hypothetical protein
MNRDFRYGIPAANAVGNFAQYRGLEREAKFILAA